MKLKMFCIYDSKVEAYNTPFFQRSTGEALRSFEDAANQQEGMKSHAEDYTLFELGEWDDGTAELVMLSTPRPLGKAIEFLRFDISDVENVKRLKA